MNNEEMIVCTGCGGIFSRFILFDKKKDREGMICPICNNELWGDEYEKFMHDRKD